MFSQRVSQGQNAVFLEYELVANWLMRLMIDSNDDMLEGIEVSTLQLKLAAIRALLPYLHIKWP